MRPGKTSITGHTFCPGGKVDSDDFSHKKWALACANAQNQTHYLSYKPKPTLRTPPRKGVPQRMNVALTQMPHTFAPHRANEDSATLRKTKSLLFRTGFRFWMAGCTRLELAISDVTARILVLNCSFACLSVLCFCRSRNCRRSGACVRIAPRRDSSVIVTEAANLIALLQ